MHSYQGKHKGIYLNEATMAGHTNKVPYNQCPACYPKAYSTRAAKHCTTAKHRANKVVGE